MWPYCASHATQSDPKAKLGLYSQIRNAALIQSGEAHAFKAAPGETSCDIAHRLHELNAITPRTIHITPIQPLLGWACAQWHVQDSSNVSVSSRMSSSDVMLDSPVFAVKHHGRALRNVSFRSIASMQAIDEQGRIPANGKKTALPFDRSFTLNHSTAVTWFLRMMKLILSVTHRVLGWRPAWSCPHPP